MQKSKNIPKCPHHDVYLQLDSAGDPRYELFFCGKLIKKHKFLGITLWEERCNYFKCRTYPLFGGTLFLCLLAYLIFR